MAPADKASHNVIVVWRLYYIHTLKTELRTYTAETYELISTDEKSVVNKHCNDIDTKFAVGITEKRFPRFIGYQNFINDLTKLVSSQTLAHVQPRVCLKY